MTRASSGGRLAAAWPAYGYMALWIGLSAGVIMLNKWILAPGMGGFPFPLALTSTHMLFCSLVSWLLVKLRLVEVQSMPVDAYVRSVVPIGVLFGATLWMGNAAYLYLSVSFIQMLKAVMPVLVYLAGVAFGTEQWSCRTGCVLLVVVAGVLTASHGELLWVAVGVVCQSVSLATEAVRLTLVQLLLQHKGLRLNPIATMYHVAPVCFVALFVPFAVLEAEQVLTHTWRVGPGVLLGSAAAAFALNAAVFLLVGKTSALTMNVAGVVKDVLLIWLSVALFGSSVTRMQVVGYSIALCGCCCYNYMKLQHASTHQQAAPSKPGPLAGAVQLPPVAGAAAAALSGPAPTVTATINVKAVHRAAFERQQAHEGKQPPV